MEKVIKNTVAAKHRCIFIAPEPPAIPANFSDPTAARIFQRYHGDNYRKAESELGLRLNSIGVTFSRIDNPAVMQLVAAEVGLLQSGASRGAGRARTIR